MLAVADLTLRNVTLPPATHISLTDPALICRNRSSPPTPSEVGHVVTENGISRLGCRGLDIVAHNGPARALTDAPSFSGLFCCLLGLRTGEVVIRDLNWRSFHNLPRSKESQ